MSSSRHAWRRWTRRGVPIASALLLAGLLAMPAQAASGTRPGHFRGVVTSHNSKGAALHARIFPAHASAATSGASASNLRYWGGPVMHSDAHYAVFWEPSGYASTASYKSTISSYFTNVAARQRCHEQRLLGSDAIQRWQRTNRVPRHGRLGDRRHRPVSGERLHFKQPAAVPHRLADGERAHHRDLP